MKKRNLVWMIGGASFIAVVTSCLLIAPVKISADLKDKLETVFEQNNIISAQYVLDGRDVIFNGDISINYNRLAQFKVSREVAGIRNIIDNQLVYKPEPAFGQILIENNQVKFTGGFKKAANLDLIVQYIHQYFSDYEIIVEAQVSERMIPLQQFLDFEYLFEHFQGNEVWFEFSDRQVVLNGRFKSAHDRALSEQKILSQISKRTSYINNIKITGLGESEQIIFQKKDNQISMSGVLADGELKANLAKLFKLYYPNNQIKMDVKIDRNLEYIDWHNQLGYLVPELGRIIEGRFKFYKEEIELEGVVDDLSTKMALISRISEAFEDSEIIDNLTIVSD